MGELAPYILLIYLLHVIKKVALAHLAGRRK